MEALQNLTSQFDSRTWVVIGVIMAALCIVSLVKKLVKLAMTLAVVAVLAFGAQYINANVLEANGISISNGEVYIANQHFTLADARGVDIKTDDGDATLEIELKSGEKVEIDIPLDKIASFENVSKILGLKVNK